MDRKPLSLILCVLVSLLHNSARAESTLSFEDMLEMPISDLSKIKVTVASQFEESLLQTGSTSVVVTPQNWQSLGARRLKDAIGALPSTLVLPHFLGSEPIFIRGFAFDNNTNGVATLLDGVALNFLEGSPQFMRQNINLGVLDRLEMIRGPGSPLYGENAFHGVLSLRFFDADKDMTQYSADYASNQYLQANLKKSIGFEKGLRLNVAVASSGQGDQNQSYEYLDTNTNGMGVGERDLNYRSDTIVLKMKKHLDDRRSLYGGIYYDHNDYGDFYSAGTTALVAPNDVGGVESEFYLLKLGGIYSLSDKLSAELRLHYFSNPRRFDQSFKPNNSSFEGIGTFVGIGKETGQGVHLILRQPKYFYATRWSMDIGFSKGEMDRYHVAQYRENGDLYNAFDLPFSFYERDTYNIAFDANSFVVDEKLIVKYGGRLDKYSDFGTVFSPRLGLIYQRSYKSAFKFLYGNAFRAPNAGEIKGFAFIGGNSDIKAETIDTYELVYVNNTESLQQEYVIFESFWKNAINIVNGQYENIGENRAYGGEFNINWQSGVWSLPFSASYIRSKNQQDSSDYTAFPRWIINAGVGYRLTSKKIDFKLNNRVHLDVSEGQRAASLPNPQDLKDYWRLDFHAVRYENSKLSYHFDIRNLLNRKNFLPSVQFSPSTGGLPDEARSVKLGFQYQL